MEILKNIAAKLKPHLYLILIGISILYFIFYTIYTLSIDFNTHLKDYQKAIEFFLKIAIMILAGGIFTVSSKYLQFLGVFKEEFEKIIVSDLFKQKLNEVVLSDEANKKIEDTLTKIILSEEYLSNHKNLNDVWENLTLCKYKKQFPELEGKIRERINNKFYNVDNISYYYKNYHLEYSFKHVNNNIVTLTQNSSYSVVRPDTSEFEWDYRLNTYEDSNLSIPKVRITIDGIERNTDVFNDINWNYKEENIEGHKIEFTSRYIKRKLKGKKEYRFNRQVVFQLDLSKDRVFSYSCDKIIDFLSFDVLHCNKLNVVMDPIYDNKFNKETKTAVEQSYSSDGICMPGEKYKLFINVN